MIDGLIDDSLSSQRDYDIERIDLPPWHAISSPMEQISSTLEQTSLEAIACRQYQDDDLPGANSCSIVVQIVLWSESDDQAIEKGGSQIKSYPLPPRFSQRGPLHLCFAHPGSSASLAPLHFKYCTLGGMESISSVGILLLWHEFKRYN